MFFGKYVHTITRDMIQKGQNCIFCFILTLKLSQKLKEHLWEALNICQNLF